jgi:small subunit ribosomal protein S20
LATHKSAEKRMRQSEKRRMKNASTKSSVKTRIKKVLESVEAKDLEKSKEELYITAKAISKAASEGVIHKNNAARKVSRLTKKVNALG